MRDPNHWPEAQHAFHLAYDEDPTPFLRTPVVWEVGNRPPGLAGLGVSTADAISRGFAVARGMDSGDSGNLVAWLASAPAGSAPVLAFPSDSWLAGRSGSGCLVGELELNGTCCIEVDGGDVIWPRYNPIVPTFKHPKPD